MPISMEEEEDYPFRRYNCHPRNPQNGQNSPSLVISATQSPPISMQPSKPNSKLLSFLLQSIVMVLVISLFFLFLGIAALLLLHIFIAGRAFRHHRRRIHRPPLTNSSGLSPKQLQNIPSFDYKTGRSNGSDCTVCLEGFLEGDRCRSLPQCKHVFHKKCVDLWLVKTPACPICRCGIVGLKEGFVILGGNPVSSV